MRQVPLRALAGLILALAASGPPGSTLRAEGTAPVGSFATYRSYEDDPVASGVAIPPALLAWLSEHRGLLGPGGFSFLVRRDAAHWMGISLRDGSLVLQIHDEGASYNFRAIVGLRTGGLTVLRGVDRHGTTREDDAREAARRAVAYLGRLRAGEAVFPGAAAARPAATGEEAAPASPAEAWDRLQAGNARFVAATATGGGGNPARRAGPATGERPYAVVIACSESRVPPETIFDEGRGGLFVIRTAGGVVTAAELGGVEYAVDRLGAGLILVLGHEGCGVIEAVVRGGELPPRLEDLASLIEPAVETARAASLAEPGKLLDAAIRRHTLDVLAVVGDSRVVQEAAEGRGLVIAAAVYHGDTGKVERIR